VLTRNSAKLVYVSGGNPNPMNWLLGLNYPHFKMASDLLLVYLLYYYAPNHSHALT